METDRTALHADVLVVGAGLAGVVAAAEACRAGSSVLLLDQEPEASLGGQAHWSFGGIFLVNSPEQRRLGVRDSQELALADWLGSAGFDRTEDAWPRRWAEAYVDFAAGEKRAWLRSLGVGFFPLVQWAERGDGTAEGHGNSVPRFHVAWGTGPGILAPFLAQLQDARNSGRLRIAYRHRATSLRRSGGAVTGVHGDVLAASPAARGAESNRTIIGSFTASGQAVVVATGGIGGNFELVRQQWPGTAPEHLLAGVPASVDGLFQHAVSDVGGLLINTDRMWHYPEGISNHSPVWPSHGIRILSGPSPLWLDAQGRRLPAPLFPGFDSLGAVRHLTGLGHGHSWLVLNRTILDKEFALSGSEQNPDLTDKDLRLLARRALPGSVGPVQEFLDRGVDFLPAHTVPELAARMNGLTGTNDIDGKALEALILARDRQVSSGLGKDAQLNAIRAARRFATDRLIRVAPPHRLLDPRHGPLIAVRLSILTRKSLGGITTDLQSRVLDAAGAVVPGLFAAGEAAGFGGGGMHGYRALEGTFLGGCLFTGRSAGRSAAGRE
jgi:predicted oxidoreductase